VDYSDEAPVFNRIVTLKDSWARKQAKPEPQKAPKPKASKEPSKKQQPREEGAQLSPEERARFEDYLSRGLRSEVAGTLARDARLAAFYEEALGVYDRPESIAKLVANDVARVMKLSAEETMKFTPAAVAELARMIDEESISTKIAKEVFEAMSAEGADPVEYVESRGLRQISDPAEIRPVVEELIAANPENLRKYREGNQRLFGFFVGQVLKATRGRANPRVVNELVKEALEG
jgi:glutaminyl-tRNA synthetase